MNDELIGPTTRGRFRDLMTGVPVGAISSAFHDEGFAPNPDCTYQDSSTRRITTQAHMESVDWSSNDHVRRALRVFERLTEDIEEQYKRNFINALRRDGYHVDPTTGHITPVGPEFPPGALGELTDPAAIREQLGRLQRAVASDDPALAVGSAKELIESTAKAVLIERGETVNERDDLPALTRKAQQALCLHPSQHTSGPDGSDAVKRILAAAASLANGVAELRNKGYGTGHGASGKRVGLRSRHARLAVNAAFTWCQLMLDTLIDPEAPWQHTAKQDQTRQ